MTNASSGLANARLDVAGAQENEECLKSVLAGYETLAVAYSGGVDSSYLCDVAHEVLGKRCEMIIADSPSLPRAEFAEAKQLAESRGWNLTIIQTDEFENETYLKNDGKRCYFCKSALFQKMQAYADVYGVTTLAYGAMADDTFDPTRLGMLAAAEFSIVAPLQEAHLGKEAIRHLSRGRDLPTADKAAFACLSSRFPVGTPVTLEDIGKVEAAEEVLKGQGFHQYRARHHGGTCRVEVGQEEVIRLLEPKMRGVVVSAIMAAGYTDVEIDPEGYKDPNQASGSAGAPC